MDASPDARKTESSMALISRVLRDHIRPHWKDLALAVLFMAVAAAMTGAMAKLMEPIVDEIFKQKDSIRLYEVAAATLIVFVVRGLSTFSHSILMNKVGQRIVASLQKRLYQHLLSSDLAFFHQNPSGTLVSRLINDVTVMRTAMAECITSIGKSTLTLLMLVGVMFWQDWVLSLIAFTVFPISAWFVARVGKRLRKLSMTTQIELGGLSSFLSQTFQGIRHVKAYGMEAVETVKASALIERLTQLAIKAYRASAITTPVTEILSGAAIVTVILYGGLQVIDGHRTAGAFFSFITAFLLAYEPMKRLAKLNGQLQMGLAAADRVFQLIDSPPTIVDRPNAARLTPRQYDVRFDAVTFAYPSHPPALRAVSFSVEAGKTVALVGPSGAGKSTILNLLLRFYDVEQGSIRIGGQDIAAVSMASLREQIALVSQEAVLFDDTVLANIAYGRPQATREEVMAAAKAANAHDFIMQLPDGYQTMVGELGVKLSGGQRQRIGIARAVLKNAPILLLDEATSSLDNESERLVQDALRDLSRGRTTLVVAHRLSTILDADCIYVLEAGQVVEAGTHGELLAKGGVYSRLYGHESEKEVAA